MVKIGDFELPLVFQVEEVDESPVEEISPLPSKESSTDHIGVQHKTGVKTLIISGFLNQELHSKNFSLDMQKDNIKKLRNTGAFENKFDYLEYDGYLSVINVDIFESSDSRIVHEVEIEGNYYPLPKYK
jgi:hypothetical protein